MTKPIKVSYSMQDTFDQCEYKADLKFIQRIKPYIPIRYPLVTGVAFHNLVDKMYQYKEFNKDFLKYNWKKEFNNALETEGSAFASTEDSEKTLLYGYSLCYKFFNFAKDNGYLIPALHSEWPFSIDYQGVTIVGKTDLIIQRRPDLPIELLDFKTGWTVHDVKKNKQLSIYDWAVKTNLKYDNVTVGIFYPRKGSIVTDVRTPEHHQQVLSQLVKVHEVLSSGTAKPNLEHCEKCEFSAYCKYFVPKPPTPSS